MIRTLPVLIVAALIGFLVAANIAPSKTVASVRSMKPHHVNAITINGLHVALPYGVKNFPEGMIALP
jgi:hypothetical protein